MLCLLLADWEPLLMAPPPMMLLTLLLRWLRLLLLLPATAPAPNHPNSWLTFSEDKFREDGKSLNARCTMVIMDKKQYYCRQQQQQQQQQQQHHRHHRRRHHHALINRITSTGSFGTGPS
jgi:curli biogenesis system outer membrane secretion channel CsgG